MKSPFALLSALIFLIAALPFSLNAELIINEVMSSNGLTIADEDGDFEDWIELWNSGDTAVDLSGHGLSDDNDRPLRWIFPDGVTIGPDEYLLVWASGKNRRDPAGELHTNFSISSDGEPILLSTPNGTQVDKAPARNIPRDLSLGRDLSRGADFYYFSEPTPGGPNTTTSYDDLLPPPRFSVDPGFFPEGVTVEIAHDDPDVQIYYSLDGSREPSRMLPYEGPISLESRAGEPNGISTIRTSPPEMGERDSNYAWEEPVGEVLKANTLTAVASKQGFLAPEPASATYFVGPEWDFVFDTNIISIVTDPNDLFDPETGIYVPGNIYEAHGFGYDAWGRPNANYHQRGPHWERPISFEYFNGNDWGLLTSGNLHMRIHGSGSRALPQKSLRIYDRGSLFGGPGLDYPFFAERPYDDFSRLILRNSGQDWNQHSAILFLDAFVQRLLKPMNLDYQAYEPAVLFLNGEYWGIHNIRERIDRYFIAQQYGVDPDRIDILTLNAQVDEGSNRHYLDMLEFMRSNDLNDPDNYAHVNELMDIGNYTDYVIAQTFIANWDWPGNNIDFWRLQTDFHPDKPSGHDGRWRWILFDLDFSFDGSRNNHERDMIAQLKNPSSGGWPNPPWSIELINLLWESADFTEAFLIRYADHMNTTFLPDRSWQLLDSMGEPLRNEIERHYLRWGLADADISQWESHIQNHKDFALNRRSIVWQHLMEHFDLEGPVLVRLRNQDSDKGALKINGIRLEEGYAGGVQGRPYEWSGEYFPELPIEVTAVADPGYAFAGWLEFPEHNSASIEFLPGEITTLTATFEQGPTHQLLHFWHFNNTNNLAALLEPSFTVGGDPAIDILLAAETEVEDGGSNGFSGENTRLDAPTGRHLRINNPIGARVDISMPSQGFHSLRFAYETRRSGQGAGIQKLSYTVNGVDYEPIQEIVVIANDPILHIWDFSEIAGANDNPEFAVRIEFEQGSGGIAGNNRIDNITLDGVPFTDFLHRDVIASNGEWNQSLAFGRFASAGKKWAYHYKAGWICSPISKNSLQGAWLWSASLESWLWMSSRLGTDWIYNASSGKWLHWSADTQQWIPSSDL